VLCASIVFGQVDHTINTVGDRSVEKAYRVAINPRIIDTIIPTPMIEYPLLVLKLDTETEVNRINPATVNTKEKLTQIYNTYVRLGVGSELMPLGEVYFDSKRSRKYIYGAHIKHLSSFGNIKNYAPAGFDRTKGLIYGGINESRYTLRGDVNYNNQGLHFYAYPSDTLIADSIRQRFSDFGMSASFKSHVKDSAKINYTVGLNYNNYLARKPRTAGFEDWRAKENYFAILSGATYKHNKEIYALDLNIKYNGYKYGELDSTIAYLDSGIVLNNTVINLKPSITTQLKDDRFKAQFGADVVFDVHTKTSVHIYPNVEVKYSMFNDIFIPYIGLRGGLQQATFKSLSQTNEFMLDNVNMLNESTPIDFYGGIKGTLSKRISFNAGISFANVKNKALFITDTTYSLGNRYAVIFDTLNRTTVEGSISYQLKEKLKIDALGKFYSYNLLNSSYAWNLPRLQFILRGSYNLFDKFIFRADLNIEEGRKALVYSAGEDVKLENGQFVKTLGFLADANIGVEYRYNNRISAFVEFNNVASQRYMRWYNAPVHAFQVMGGITYRF